MERRGGGYITTTEELVCGVDRKLRSIRKHARGGKRERQDLLYHDPIKYKVKAKIESDSGERVDALVDRNRDQSRSSWWGGTDTGGWVWS